MTEWDLPLFFLLCVSAYVHQGCCQFIQVTEPNKNWRITIIIILLLLLQLYIDLPYSIHPYIIHPTSFVLSHYSPFPSPSFILLSECVCVCVYAQSTFFMTFRLMHKCPLTTKTICWAHTQPHGSAGRIRLCSLIMLTKCVQCACVCHFKHETCVCMCVCVFVCHLSVSAECEAGDAMCVSITEQRDGLDSEGVPHTHIRVLPHLTRCHQGALRVQRQAGGGEEGGREREKNWCHLWTENKCFDSIPFCTYMTYL